MTSSKKYVLFAIFGVIVVALIIVYVMRHEQYIKEPVPAETNFQDVEKNVKPSITPTKTPNPTTPSEKPTPIATNTPPELNLDAPFYSQAPFGNWDFPWQEACEEASILLAANVYGQHNWTRAQFNDQILQMVAWEKDKFGTYTDTTVAQTAQIVNDYLHLKTITHENPTYEDVQAILQKGHFIVMFFAGKELKNPNFNNGGPTYHALLVKGYKAGQKIITNDVGTKNGANYVYSWSILQSAMHDFDIPIDNGAKRILEILPPQN